MHADSGAACADRGNSRQGVSDKGTAAGWPLLLRALSPHMKGKVASQGAIWRHKYVKT